MENQDFGKQKLKEKHLRKHFEDDRIEEQNQSPKFLFSLIFSNPKTQNQIWSLKAKNTFENLEINSRETLIFLAKKSYQNPKDMGLK